MVCLGDIYIYLVDLPYFPGLNCFPAFWVDAAGVVPGADVETVRWYLMNTNGYKWDLMIDFIE